MIKEIRIITALAIVFILTGIIVSPASSGPREDFSQAYLLIREANRLVWEKETDQVTCPGS